MALLTLNDAHLAYGHVFLLGSAREGASFSLEAGERVGLIGRNGTGKSSFMRIVAGLELPDDGRFELQQGLRRAYVPQEPTFAPGATVFEAAAEGLREIRALRERFEAGDHADELFAQIDAQDGWAWEQRVEATLHRLGLDAARRVDELSGGLKKRVALAQALVARPDVLLLDEPTNHLDLGSIAWLEGLLNAFKGAVMLVTHDRAFLDGVCTRIVELDRGVLRSYPGNFAAYELTKARELEDEALANARADKLLAQEEVWIRKGVEARRTRAVARIKRLDVLRQRRAERRDAVGQVRLDVAQGQRSGKIVAELTDVTKAFVPGRPVVRDFSATILRSDKVGLIGPNGAGKTTLLKLILGEIQPDSGTVRQGANLSVAYFDQMRDNLQLDATLADFISPGSEWIEIAHEGHAATHSEGKVNRKHVMSYLGDFLFPPERANAPVRTLSGGERNRLLLARLFARPANVLVLDEPTNDLDIDTLDLLEELLQDYPGTVFLVSHDRRFLDNVVTSTLVFEGDGRWREYEGGVGDWALQAQRAQALAVAMAQGAEPAAAAPAPVNRGLQAEKGPEAARNLGPAAPATEPRRRKLSYKEQRELEALPALLASLEAEQAAIQAQLADGTLYARDPGQATQLAQRHAELDDALLAALERQEALGT